MRNLCILRMLCLATLLAQILNYCLRHFCNNLCINDLCALYKHLCVSIRAMAFLSFLSLMDNAVVECSFGSRINVSRRGLESEVYAGRNEQLEYGCNLSSTSVPKPIYLLSVDLIVKAVEARTRRRHLRGTSGAKEADGLLGFSLIDLHHIFEDSCDFMRRRQHWCHNGSTDV